MQRLDLLVTKPDEPESMSLRREGATPTNSNRRRLFVIGVEKDTVLPSLRTVRAVFPHTALQLVVSSSGLARSLVGCSHSEQSHVCEVCIWPSSVIVMAVSHSRSLFLLAQD